MILPQLDTEDVVKELFTGKYPNSEIWRALAFLEQHHPDKFDEYIKKYQPEYYNNSLRAQGFAHNVMSCHIINRIGHKIDPFDLLK